MKHILLFFLLFTFQFGFAQKNKKETKPAKPEPKPVEVLPNPNVQRLEESVRLNLNALLSEIDKQNKDVKKIHLDVLKSRIDSLQNAWIIRMKEFPVEVESKKKKVGK